MATYTSSFIDKNTNTTAGHVQQSYSSSNTSRPEHFANTNFTVAPNFVKWSVNINTTTAFPDGMSFNYQLKSLSSLQGDALAPSQDITKTNSQNITTYYLPLSSSSSSSSTVNNYVVALELFDVALVDGDYLPITHNLTYGNTSTGYSLLLQFPSFNSSLYYDPSVGLGVLVSGSGSGGGGSNNNILIVAVAVPVIVVVVLITLGIIVGATAKLLWNRRRVTRVNRSFSVNYDDNL